MGHLKFIITPFIAMGIKIANNIPWHPFSWAGIVRPVRCPIPGTACRQPLSDRTNIRIIEANDEMHLILRTY